MCGDLWAATGGGVGAGTSNSKTPAILSREALVEACRDPWSKTYSPMLFPSGTDTLLALPEPGQLEYPPLR